MPPSRRNVSSCSAAQRCALDAKGEQADALPAEAEREDEQARAAVLSGAGVPHHRALTVIDLAFLARRRGDHRVRVRRALAAELHHEAPHARIPGREAVLIDEVLPDRHGVATAAESQLDELAVRRAGTRGRGPVARRRPRRELRKAWRARPGVGGHLTGRFWWRPPAAGRADRDSGGLEIAARRLATNAGRLFDAAERPAQPPQSENLLPLVIPQDVGHSGGEPCAPPPRQRLGTALLHWPVLGVHRGRCELVQLWTCGWLWKCGQLGVSR